ncbi:MAG TPA: class I mannose-6-phosphate isomerase [Allosphingosinicella sp.]|nr:class I mannose-6-phosphate isomerase [Allosphingosinicella sp.]
MTALRLTARRLAKVWGRRDLLPPFPDVPEDEEPVGEIWFEHPDGGDLDLLVKYLFTSERLSIQVHPDDAAARAAGEKSGKDEAWLILEAEPGATIGLGLRERVSPEALRAAALDGSIEALIDWRPVRAGEIIYSPAGTIHAIGPGLKIVEVQQNVDLTYRLYDYGRPRELHLEQAIAVANPAPHEGAADLAFTIGRHAGPFSGCLRAPSDCPHWLVPISGRGRVDGESVEAGGVWLVRGGAEVILDEGADLLVARNGQADISFG